MGVCKKIKRKSYTDFTVSEVFDLFKTEKIAYGITEKTINNYRDSLKRFKRVLELDNPKLNQIDEEDRSKICQGAGNSKGNLYRR